MLKGKLIKRGRRREGGEGGHESGAADQWGPDRKVSYVSIFFYPSERKIESKVKEKGKGRRGPAC
jgi:hypothetical protein